MAIKLIHADVFDALKTLPDKSVHCVITSPPYHGLRNYNAEGMIGLEPTFEEHLDILIQVFREVRRVLRDDGTLWLNYGDAYAGSGRGGGSPGKEASGHVTRGGLKGVIPSGLKPQDLMMMPAEVALALRADGWWLRSEVIWHKPNPMPESVKNRPTQAHEKIYLMSKAKRYFYDHVAVRIPAVKTGTPGHLQSGANSREHIRRTPAAEKSLPNGWATSPYYQNQHPDYEKRPLRGRKQDLRLYEGPYKQKRKESPNDDRDGHEKVQLLGDGSAQLRNVWTVPTHSYSGAHFACVDESTEALTDSGWVYFSDLNVGDRIASFDMNAGRCRWDTVDDIAVYEVVEQPMIRILGRGIDQLLTPNHRCVIQRRSGNTDIVRADNLLVSHKTIVASQWDDSDVDFPEDLASLIGWYVTEGNAGHERITLYQSGDANPEYCNEIRDLLRREGAQFTESSRKRQWRDREVIAVSWRVTGAVANALLSLCPEKRLPEGFLTWKRAPLLALWDAIMKGDGLFRDAGRATFVQKDKVLTDQVQALATRLGYSTTMRERSTHTWALYKTVSKTRLLRSANSGLISTVPYTGVVWCPKTSTGTWIARRNHRVFITGNTFPPALIEPCIKAGTSEYGTYAVCGAPWIRQTESTVDYQSGSGKSGRQPKGKYDGAHQTVSGGADIRMGPVVSVETTGWQPDCDCDASVIPATVLDPFAGAGTVGLVAHRLGRDAFLIELNPDYVDLARTRLCADARSSAHIECNLPERDKPLFAGAETHDRDEARDNPD